MIPLCEPTLGERELGYLRTCIEDGWVSADGPFVGRLESAIAQWHGTGMHACCSSSGTTALQLALVSLGLNPGQIVLVPSLSFVATLNPVIHCGAEPLVLDVERETLGLDPQVLRTWLGRETLRRQGLCYDRKTGRRIFGVIAVHLYGIPCAIHELKAVCDEFGLRLVEDNAEALGALAGGVPTGSIGDASILSFNGNKTITAGGGGMVLSRDEELVTRARYWSNQARTHSAADPGDFGFNYRMSNLQAAVGLAQFERMDELLAARREHHSVYREGFGEAGLSLVEGRSEDSPSWWLHVLRDNGSEGVDRLEAKLRERGISSRRVFQPFDRSPLYGRFARAECCVAGSARDHCLALPSSAHLAPADQRRIIEAVAELLGRRAEVLEATG